MASAPDVQVPDVVEWMRAAWPTKKIEYETGVLTISPWGDDVTGPVHFHLGDGALRDACRVDPDTHQSLWPTRSAEEAAVFWFWTRMDELLRGHHLKGEVHVRPGSTGHLVHGDRVEKKPKFVVDKDLSNARLYAPMTNTWYRGTRDKT